MKDKIKKIIGAHKIKKPHHIFLSLVIILAGVFSFIYFFGNYSKFFSTEIALEKKSDILPKEPLIFYFSNPVIKKSYKNKISFYPKTDFKEVWNESGTNLYIYPEHFWEIESRYGIYFPGGINKMLAKTEKKHFSFNTGAYPKVSNIFPENNAKDVVIGIEDPILIGFDRPVSDFDVKFSLYPPEEIIFEYDQENNQYKILPKEKIKDGQKYRLKAEIKYKEAPEADYKEAYAGYFETLPPPPETWEKDFALRLDQARKLTRPKIFQGKYIDINLEIQIMSLFQDGKLLDSFLISSGKKGMETPEGRHQVYNKSPRTWSKQYGLFMPLWMAIAPSGKYGIHELPEWPGGYKEGSNHLGTPVSHGCVRLGVGAAEKVYNFADIGTPVVTYKN